MRQVPGWHFFNEHVAVCDVVRPGGIQALTPDDRTVVEWFISVLGGCRRVLDVGCGSGFPSLYLANHVGAIDGIDAAPNAIARAKAHASKLGIENVTFTVGGEQDLPFTDGTFDGVMLCGVLESMDWDDVRPMLAEVRRVLSPGGHIAILDQDWADVVGRRPAASLSLRSHDHHPLLLCCERLIQPPLERTTYYLLDDTTAFTRALLAQSADNHHLSLSVEEIDPRSVLDAWYEEVAQFDLPSLTDLILAQGFTKVTVVKQAIWDQQVLLLSGTR